MAHVQATVSGSFSVAKPEVIYISDDESEAEEIVARGSKKRRKRQPSNLARRGPPVTYISDSEPEPNEGNVREGATTSPLKPRSLTPEPAIPSSKDYYGELETPPRMQTPAGISQTSQLSFDSDGSHWQHRSFHWRASKPRCGVLTPEPYYVSSDQQRESTLEEDAAQSITLSQKDKGRNAPSPEHLGDQNTCGSSESQARTPVFAPLFQSSQSSQSSQQSTKSRPSHHDKSGCIYICHDDHTNHVKIGMTVALKKRFGEIKRKCQKPHLTLEWHTTDSIPWTQLQQLEKIVHWDLEKFNRPYKCDCGRQHTEWFDVEIREARRTVEMWLRYQRMNPHATPTDLQRLKVGFPTEEGPTWIGNWSLSHIKRYEFWYWKLFGEEYDESFSEE